MGELISCYLGKFRRMIFEYPNFKPVSSVATPISVLLPDLKAEGEIDNP
jgi:hypothetical protein